MEILVADGLRKRYGDTAALDGFDLAVPAGSVCALLGPNGAGKTTAVRILSTLLRLDGGSATVAGYDVARRPAEVRRRIGLVGQRAAVDEVLSGYQNLVMFGRLYHLSRSEARARARSLLDRFGLADTGSKAVKKYSGGMRRRLDLAAGLILAPKVLFLDEPTTGLDPRGRAEVWQAVRELVAAGTTVLLTTQYLDEADQLADSVCLIDHGRAVTTGTPDELKAALGGDRIDVVLRRPDDVARAASLLGEAFARFGGEVKVEPDLRRVSVAVRDRMAALAETLRLLADARLEAADINLRRPTLDEVFLHLTDVRA
jgi:ABC-2 type transport system ATP-binding protein